MRNLNTLEPIVCFGLFTFFPVLYNNVIIISVGYNYFHKRREVKLLLHVLKIKYKCTITNP